VSAVTQADQAAPGSVPASGLTARRGLGDRSFQWLALGCGLLVLVILVLIAVTTTQQASSWFTTEGWGIFGTVWDQAANKFGATPFIYGTAVTGVIALVMAVPVSIGIALLLTEVVPYRVARPIVYVVDLLAVVPSVVWGLWGILVFAPWIQHIYARIASAVTGVPVLGFFFGTPTSGASFFTAGIILAFMITPIVTSLSREVIATVPATDREGAYALGATRWEMIRMGVLRNARIGIVGAIILGLGRALGETMAVTMVIGNTPEIHRSLLANGSSMSAVIANEYAEAVTDLHRSALTEIALALFIVTIVVNAMARLLVWAVTRGTPARVV